jgi:hypothetical protein
MTRHGPALLALSVLAIAGWTYNVNYDTRAALERISELRASIAGEREALQVLRVEWAYLNAPDRLARLVAEHNDRLALGPLTPDALGTVATVPYPPDMPGEPTAPESSDMLVADASPSSTPLPPAEDPLLAAIDETLTDTAAIDPAAPGPGMVGPALAAAAEKGEIVAAAPAEPASMRDAVTLALIEAGVVEPGAVSGRAAIVPASVTVGSPVPPARPAVWTRR